MSAPRTRIAGVVYPPAAVAADYAAHQVLPQATLIEALAATMRERGDAVAVSTTTSRITYAELDRRSDAVAAGLLSSGLKPLDSVLFQLPNGIELVLYFVACLKAGLIPICTLLAHRENEIGSIGRQLGARAHLVPFRHGQHDWMTFSAKCRQEVPTLLLTLTTTLLDGETQAATSLAALEAAGDEPAARAALGAVERDAWQVAIYQLSGGTTGTPKVIPRFQNDYLHNLRCTVDRLGFHPDDRMLSITPMMHNASFLCSWGSALLVGAETVAADGIQPRELLEAILNRRPTWSMISEIVISRTRDLPAAALLWVSMRGHLEGGIGARLRHLGSLVSHIRSARKRGMPASTAIWSSFRGLLAGGGARRIQELTGVPTYPFFGMTEGVIFFAGPADPDEVRFNTLGHPIAPDDCFRVLGPGTEDDLPDGQVGELVIRGPYTLHGYFDAEARNREAFTSDGWYRTGDLMSAVTINGHRCVQFQGRLKDVIDRGGEKINCQELETLLQQHSSIAAAAVVPMPDPEYGERACAFVVQVSTEQPLTLDDIQRHFASLGVAKFKWPERLELTDALPLTASGKLQKAPLRDLIREKLAAERQNLSAERIA